MEKVDYVAHQFLILRIRQQANNYTSYSSEYKTQQGEIEKVNMFRYSRSLVWFSTSRFAVHEI